MCICLDLRYCVDYCFLSCLKIFRSVFAHPKTELSLSGRNGEYSCLNISQANLNHPKMSCPKSHLEHLGHSWKHTCLKAISEENKKSF